MVLYHLQSPELWEVRAKITLKSLERLKIGLSRSSLHTKAFLIDREKLFIGSFNWDPRSANINTEMGIVLDSPGLATEAGDGLSVALRQPCELSQQVATAVEIAIFYEAHQSSSRFEVVRCR